MPDDPTGLSLPPSPPASLMGGQAPTAPKGSSGGWDATPEPEAEHRVGDPANPIEDIVGITKDLAGGVSHVVKGYWDLIDDPKVRDEYKKGVADLFSGKYHKDVGNYLWKGLKEDVSSHWTNPEGNFDLGYTVVHHPASALMDLAVVKDIAAGGLKMTGKTFGGASRAMMAAEEAAKLGQMSRADKLVKLGETIGKVPMDPYQLIAKGAEKIPGVQGMKHALGFGATTPEKAVVKDLDALAAHSEAEVNMESAAKQQLIERAKYGEEGAARIRGALDRGSAADFAALKPEESQYIKAYKDSQTIPHNREKFLLDRGLITEDERVGALAKQASLHEFGNVEPQNVATAAEKIKSGEWKPTYRYLATEKSHEYNMLENLFHDLNGSPTKVGFLESRTGMGNYVKDPRTAAMMQVKMETQFDKKIRLFDRSLDMLNEKGLLKFAKTEKDIPQGWKVIPTDIAKKYMLAEKRAAGLAWANATRGMDATSAARDAYAKMLTDPVLMSTVQSSKVVAVPNYVANWMRFRLGLPGPLARTYDTLARYWKSSATLLRPQYWINVAAGNGFLSALHGVQFGDAVRYWKNRNFLPPELRSIMQTAVGPEGATRWQQATTNLRNFDGMIHTHLTKGPGFAHEVESIRRDVQATAKTLHQAGQQFFITADILADPNKFYQLVAQSPEKLSKAVQEHVVLREQIAGQIPELRYLRSQVEKQKAILEKAEEGYNAVKESLSQKERASGGSIKWNRLKDQMEQGQMMVEQLSKLRDEVKGGVRRMATASEQDLIYGFGGPKTGKKNVIAIPSQPQSTVGNQMNVISPKEPFLMGARGRAKAARLDELQEQIGVALKNAKDDLAGKASEFEKAKKQFFDIQGDRRLEALDKEIGQKVAKAQEIANEYAGKREEYLQAALKEGVVRKSMPDLQRIAGWAEKSIEHVNLLEGAYLRLHPLERQWISRAIPFYPWTKAMSKLVFMLPFIYPGRTFMWNRWAGMMNDLTSHEEHMPEYLQGSVPIGHTADGGTVYVRPFWDPFKGEEHPKKLGGVTLPGIVGDLPMRHPLFKVMHDLVGGTDTFTMKPFSTDETMTRMDTGEVFQLDPKSGMWNRTIAQPSLWRKLWGLFPQSQMIDKLFLPHVQSDKGWVGHNDPLLVGGEPIQIPFYQRALQVAGFPLTFQSEDQKNMAEAKQAKIYKQYVQEIKKMPEGEREAAMRVLNDALRSRK